MDLEHLGPVQIPGIPDVVAPTCHPMAIELAASSLADTLQAVCVGFGHYLVVDQLAEALPLVEEKTQVLAAETATP